MAAKSHELIRLSAEIRSDMACGTIILLEEFISLQFIFCNCRIITAEPHVESRVRCDKCALELLDRIRDVVLRDTVRIDGIESLCHGLVSLKLGDDMVK